MSFLTDLLKEEAAAGATAAHAVAGTGGHEGGADISKKKKKKKTVIKPMMTMLRRMHEGEGQFDTADVISKLKAAEKEAGIDDDTITFGLEDENGGIVKVHVRAEQAEDFQKAVESAMAENMDETDSANSSLDIAEVIFELKDKFDIVNIDWPAIPEDEEEAQELEGGEEGMEGDAAEGEGGEEGMEGDGEDDMEGLEGDEMDGGDSEEDDAASALTQVIDMMKADAEAKKAEAEARKAEANSRTAAMTTKAAEAKVKQEEEVLDMEDYYSKQSDGDKESKRLAKLAKYKHDLSKDSAEPDIDMDVDMDVDMSEDEEDIEDKEITAKQNADNLLQLLLKQRAQG